MLSKYIKLIEQLPVRNLEYKTKRSTWIKVEKEHKWLADLNDILFNGFDHLAVCRDDVFRSASKIRELIVLTIYWGYPNGMRGEHVQHIFKNIDLLEKVLLSYGKLDSPTSNDYFLLKKRLAENSRIGFVNVQQNAIFSKL